jgi:transcription elongation factor GreA
MQKHPMTVQGAHALREELNRLKSIDRPRIIEAIATAREHGDLKENAEYHAAREEQSFMEGRIQDLEAKLSHARIVDLTGIENNGRVVFGVTVRLCHIETNAEVTYQIVGEDEADIKKNKISYSSPMGRALIGKSVDDEIVVHAPGGKIEYEIIHVDYTLG